MAGRKQRLIERIIRRVKHLIHSHDLHRLNKLRQTLQYKSAKFLTQMADLIDNLFDSWDRSLHDAITFRAVQARLLES